MILELLMGLRPELFNCFFLVICLDWRDIHTVHEAKKTNPPPPGQTVGQHLIHLRLSASSHARQGKDGVGRDGVGKKPKINEK